MNKKEITHNQCKEELQDLYEKKLECEQKKFKKLKDDQQLMTRKYENEIIRLKEYYEMAMKELNDENQEK